jgi:hypothetical protein
MAADTNHTGPMTPLCPQMKECIHPFQCPNPMCKRVSISLRGLTLHYHLLKNLFCNPSHQYHILAEESVNFELPPRVDTHLTDIFDSEEGSFPDVKLKKNLKSSI